MTSTDFVQIASGVFLLTTAAVVTYVGIKEYKRSKEVEAITSLIFKKSANGDCQFKQFGDK